MEIISSWYELIERDGELISGSTEMAYRQLYLVDDAGHIVDHDCPAWDDDMGVDSPDWAQRWLDDNRCMV